MNRRPYHSLLDNAWVQLAIGIVAMVALTLRRLDAGLMAVRGDSLVGGDAGVGCVEAAQAASCWAKNMRIRSLYAGPPRSSTSRWPASGTRQSSRGSRQ